MALVCDFSTIQIVLMPLKLISYNPNSGHGSAFQHTETYVLLGILSTPGSDKTQHNPNRTHASSFNSQTWRFKLNLESWKKKFCFDAFKIAWCFWWLLPWHWCRRRRKTWDLVVALRPPLAQALGIERTAPWLSQFDTREQRQTGMAIDAIPCNSQSRTSWCQGSAFTDWQIQLDFRKPSFPS